MAARILGRVAVRDRALFDRLQLADDASHLQKTLWMVATHAGGASASLCAAIVPLWLDGSVSEGGRRATVVLVASHLVVQLIKRTVSRPRPVSVRGAIAAPDRFSFPSGHAAASFSVALGFASVYPVIAAPLVALAGLVGASRIILGVHYPADVIAGQAIALLTAAALSPVL